jgi:hypothetical protein
MNTLHGLGSPPCDEAPVMIARIASFTFGIIAPPALVGWLVFLH